jgi:putative DNA primase/helicase
MPTQHDGPLDLATGRSRTETNWRNKEWLWSALVDRLRTTHRTAETQAEYLSSKKSRQDEIKDIGGFVGGYLAGGSRKAGAVQYRQIITLDLDFAHADFWQDFILTYGNAAAMYSTHKHTPDNPRLRLILPLDRQVKPDEYQAICRKIAGILGIELFDPTTFQAERLMYWPSTSKDAEYLFEHQDGEWLSADGVLAMYHNWQDSSEWPVSITVDKIVQRNITKQGDPLEKPGIIGAFCRTYNIHEAIELLLPDSYEACATENRYSYKHGSTGAGLITYDDKYAYSHHGSDPISGKLCNAYDLVRLHKFGLQDEDARADTPGNKLPSYTAMVAFVLKDEKVRLLIGSERLQEAHEDFKDFLKAEGVEADDTEWMRGLEIEGKSGYKSTINNIVLILENDTLLKGAIAFDEFEQRAITKRNFPWRKITHKTRFLIDRDDANIEHYLENGYGIGAGKLVTAMDVIYERTRFHPVRDYLQGLVWDGVDRVDTLFIDYLGAADSEYIRAVTRKTLCAAVARVHQPGVKFDYAPIFVGKQGIGKSSLIGKLGKEWYSDSFSTVQGKESFEQIQGVWIVEMGELAGLRKAEVDAIKHYTSKCEDRYRVAYGHRTDNFPRQCVFFGSTNKRDFLRDPTGGRRFWPVDIADGVKPKYNLFKDLTPAEVGQVWAEAVIFYEGGEPLHLSPELEAAANLVQADHLELDPRAGTIQKYLETLLPVNWESMGQYDRRAYLIGNELQSDGFIRRDKVCAAEIWCEALGCVQKDMSTHNTKFIHDVMRTMEGWKESVVKGRYGNYGVLKGYERFVATENVLWQQVATNSGLGVATVATKLPQK